MSEIDVAYAARIKAKTMAREQSAAIITAECEECGIPLPKFNDKPVMAKRESTPEGQLIAMRKRDTMIDIRKADVARCSDGDGGRSEMSHAEHKRRGAETNDWLGKFQYDPVAMRAALDKKLDANHKKYAADMQTTQTGEAIKPEYVINAERHAIKNEKEKLALKLNAEPPSNDNWFTRLWRWLSFAQNQVRPGYSVQEMSNWGKR